MQRPYVICHMLQSADGKVSGEFLEKAELAAATETYFELHRAYGADAFAIGRTTAVESFTKGYYPDLSRYSGEGIDLSDYVGGAYRRYAVIFDRQGRVGWKSAAVEDDDLGYDGAHIIEVLSETVDKRYLAYLKDIGVSYIFAGKDGSDIEKALDKLVEKFGICNLLLEGGSEINGAFAAAGVIDELSLLVSPVKADADGKPLFARALSGTPHFMSATPYPDGVILMRYSVK